MEDTKCQDLMKSMMSKSFVIMSIRKSEIINTGPNLSLLLQNILFLTTLTHFLLIARKRDLDLLTLYLASVRIDTWFNVVGIAYGVLATKRQQI